MLVTGAAGMVGSYVPRVFNEAELVLTDIMGDFPRLDVRDPVAVMQMVRDVRPDVVLHLAAATDVDRCQQEPDWAYHTNSVGTQNIVLACQATGALLVYIGTAGVFWGDKPEPYTEFDVPRPANIYGDTKLQGEQIIASLLHQYYIVRAGWMIGGGKRDKKFVGMIANQIMAGKTKLRIVNDKFGSPTYAKDLLSGIKKLLSTGYYGLYHMVNAGTSSRYDVAVAMCDIINRPDIEIEPVSSAYFPLPAPRARSEAMRNYKLELLGLNSMRSWREALEEYMLEELMQGLEK
jgi:dTDP-4-dehydrorhamnose reductase